jgi:hypothetical protein
MVFGNLPQFMKFCVVHIKVLACVSFQMSIVSVALMYTMDVVAMSYLTVTTIPESAKPV